MQPVRALQSTGKSKACFTWHYAFVKNSLLKLINKYLEERGWSPAELARKSGQSKATISRITNYGSKNNEYRPSRRTIIAIGTALHLIDKQEEEWQRLLDTAFPEERISIDMAKRGCSVSDIDVELSKRKLPLLSAKVLSDTTPES